MVDCAIIATGTIAGGDGKRSTTDDIELFEVADVRLRGVRVDCAFASITPSLLPAFDPAAEFHDAGGPVGFKTMPELEATPSKPPATLAPDRTYRLRLTLRNPGEAPTGRVRLRVGAARGLTARLAKSVPSLAPGATRTVSLTASLSRRAKPRSVLRVTAVAGLLEARAGADLRREGGGGRSQTRSSPCNRWVPDITGHTGGSLLLVPC